MRTVLQSLILVALLVIGCKQTKKNTDDSSINGRLQLEDPIVVSYGINGGFGRSTSSWEVRVTTDSVICNRVQAKVNNDTLKPLIKKRSLRKGERERVLSLVNLKMFYALPTQIGCPGCDDGLVEWLRIRENYYSKTIYIEQDSTVESLKALIEELDNLHCDQ